MRRRLALCAAVAASAVIAGCGSSSNLKPLSSLGQLKPAPNPGKRGPELVPVPNAPALGLPAATAHVAKGVDGIKCERNEPVAFHIHTHLTVFVDGKPRLVPAGIGIWPALQPQRGFGQFVLTQNECLAWLVTRFADGIIHIEAPVKRSFTLGEFFDVWGQPLGPNVAGSAHGPVTAIVDGKVWTGDPRDIELKEHEQIQLEVGRPLVAPETITWPGSY